jgi:peptide/nickel transport system substrate-binding protein
MKTTIMLLFLGSFLLSACGPGKLDAPTGTRTGRERLMLAKPVIYGGRLVIALRSEPKTLNPVVASDVSSREVIEQMTADLIHINRYTQLSELCLAKSWKASANGLHYTLVLRRNLRFSDGVPFDADDVIFSFRVYLDEKVNAPQRDTLLVEKTPISVQKIDPYIVTIALARPYASAERLFDSISILPRHLLEHAYAEGKLAKAWGLNTSPNQIAGLGPFRMKEYVPGQYLTLQRNPYYWKRDSDGNPMPYLSELTFLFVGNEQAQVLRFEAGDADVIDRISAEDFSTLQREQVSRRYHLYDLGPDLDYNFLLFNLNSKLPVGSADVGRKQQWFDDVRFRQAISSAIDREAMNRVVYHGRGAPIWTHVTPGNRLWFDPSVPRPSRSLSRSKDLLKSAGFSWTKNDGYLVDRQGTRVEFSVITSTSANERVAMATMIQQDLRALGIRLQVVPLEFHSMLDRVFNTHDYDTAVMGLGGGDVDPNSQMNVWLSSGDDHLWNSNQAQPATLWEAQIDRLMRQQMYTLSPEERKRLYDRVQEIEAEEVPVVCLVSPNLLVGARDRIRNFTPAVLDSHTLWNSNQLFLNDRVEVVK